MKKTVPAGPKDAAFSSSGNDVRKLVDFAEL